MKQENFDREWILELESLIDQLDPPDEKRAHFRFRLPSIDKENKIMETKEKSLNWWKMIMDSIKSEEKRGSENANEKDIKSFFNDWKLRMSMYTK